MRTLAALIVFTNWLPNATDEAAKTAGSTPLPLNCTVCGEAEELLLTLRVPERAPRAVGAKVTEIIQLDPTAKILGEIGHFEVCLKSPETEILLITSGTVALLVKVTVLGLLVVPTTQFPKGKLLGLKV